MTGRHPAIAEGAPDLENRPCLPAVWTAESAREFARTLAPREFAVLVEALKSHADIQQAILLLDEIRAGLGPDLPQVAAVYFEAFDYDGWFYLNESATVYYRDGRTPSDCDFSITVNEIMTSLYGPVGETTGLLIVPGLGEFELWETNAADELELWLAAHGPAPAC